MNKRNKIILSSSESNSIAMINNKYPLHARESFNPIYDSEGRIYEPSYLYN